MKVLLVEKNNARRGQMKVWLERLVDSVSTASDGVQGLGLFTAKQSEGGFDLVITDKHMPHMDGVEMAQGILKVKPDQKILMLTIGEHTDEMRQLGLIFQSKLTTSWPQILESLIADLKSAKV